MLIKLTLTDRFYYFAKISLNVIHDDEKGIDLFRGGNFWCNDVQKLGEEAHTFRAHFGQSFHDLNLSQDFDHFVFVLSEAFDHFNGDLLARDVTYASHNATVGALAFFIDESIIL